MAVGMGRFRPSPAGSASNTCRALVSHHGRQHAAHTCATVIRVALSRGLALMKLPLNDPFTAVAILRTMADLEPDHPVVTSLSAFLLSRGGDSSVESVLMQPQFFDKIVVWGGEAPVQNVVRISAPGSTLSPSIRNPPYPLLSGGIRL